MSVKYKLVQRKDFSEGAGSDAKLWYAQGESSGNMTFEELCDEISESCTLTSADVKAALDRLTWVLSRNLQAGRIVQMGELGNFRLTIGSKGTITEDEFDTSLIKKPKVTFYPGKKLQQARTETSFERIDVKEEETEDEGTV